MSLGPDIVSYMHDAALPLAAAPRILALLEGVKW